MPPCLVGPGWCGAGAGLGRERRGDTTYFAPLLPTQTVSRLGGGFPLGRGGAGPVLGYNGHCSHAPHANSLPAGKWFSAWLARRGASAGIQRTLLPCSLRKQSPGWEVVFRLAGAARGQCWDTTDIAPHAPYANSPPAGLAVFGAGEGLGRGYNGHCSLAPYPNSLPAGRWFCRLAGLAGAARARGQCWDTTDIAPLLRTRTVPRLGSGFPLGWYSRGGAGLGRVRSGDTTAFAPHAPYSNSPHAGLAWCGTGAGLGRRCNGHCPPCTLRKQSPCWFGRVRRGCGASAGIQRHLFPYSLRKQSPARRWFCRHVWLGRGGAGLGQERRGDTTYFAPLLPTQTVSQLGGGFAAMSGWAGAARGWGRSGAGIQRTLLPCSLRKQSPGWEVVFRLAGAARGQCWDTTDIAPYAPYANSPPAGLAVFGAGEGLGRGYNGICSLTPYANSPRLGGGFAAMSGWAGAARGWGRSGAGIQRTLLPCSLRKQSPG